MNIRAATVSLVIITVITSFCADYRMFFHPFRSSSCRSYLPFRPPSARHLRVRCYPQWSARLRNFRLILGSQRPSLVLSFFPL